MKNSENETTEWYLVDEKHNEPAGPYSTEQVRKFIAEGRLNWDHFIWARHHHHKLWKRVFEFSEFHEVMLKYPTVAPPKRFTRASAAAQFDFSKEGEYGVENQYRRYPRAPLDVEVIIHNDREICWGRTTDISEKGSYIRVEEDRSFRLGDEIKATFRGIPDIGTISTTAVIMRQESNQGNKGLGLFFYKLSPKLRRQLALYVIRSLADAAGAGKQASSA